VVVLALCAAACAGGDPASERVQADRLQQRSRWGTSSVFTPARTGVADAVRTHFGIRRDPEQPFAYSHRLHLENELVCTDCHAGVETGPQAGIPGVATCMTCHAVIATDRPLIQTLAAMHEQGRDLDWQRVYDYPREAHVRFEHGPHIRAKVECSTCHGDLRQQDVATRVVEMDMAFCVNCHTQKQASNDCLTCHY